MQIPEPFFELLTISSEEKSKLKEALNQEPSLSIRYNPRKNAQHLDTEKTVSWASNAHYLAQRPPFIEDPLFHAGTYYVQEASSMFIEFALNPFLKPNMKILDLCASPGGKSTHLLSMISSDSILISNEVIKSRANILAENILKWGHSNVVVTSNEVKDFSDFKEAFDVVLIDAPCSGEGMFRKSQEARQEWSPNLVELCSARQKKILAESVDLLKEGGILLYSTCTFNPHEDENNVDWLIKEFNLKSLSISLEKECGIIEVESPLSHSYKFYPGKVRGEGFFLSLMQKGESNQRKDAHRKKRNSGRTIQTQKELPIPFELEEGCCIAKLKNEQLSVISSVHRDFIASLNENLYCLQVGTPIGEIIHNKFKFHHGAAMSKDIKFPNIPLISISQEQTLMYLSKVDFHLETKYSGWVIFTYQNFPIGFAKILGNRTNNYYPSYFRIRKDLKF